MLRSAGAAFGPLFCLYGLVLTGCAVPADPLPSAPSSTETRRGAPPAAPPRYNLTGYSESFKQGYADACARRRNDSRFKTDGDYRMGWSDGSNLCRSGR